MKQWIFFFLIIFVSINMTAQNNWKVYLGKKELLGANTENESKNIVKLTAADLKDEVDLVITFYEAEPQKDWTRIISVFGNNDTELVKKEGVRMLRISMNDLKTYLQNNNQLKIYTWSLPLDPELAARVRIRRVHLCTVEKK